MADWHVATLKNAKMVAENVRSLTFSIPDFPPHKSGQHINLRLTAEDGYQAERDYSIANPPNQKGEIELGIELLTDGEVSPYLFEIAPGAQIEIRSPVGGHFVWDTNMDGPLILIAGGSGMVPLMSMLREHIGNISYDNGREILFLISAQNLGRVLYKEELAEIEKKDPHTKIIMTLTKEIPPNWNGYLKRVGQELLTKVIGELKNKMPIVYVCGPTPFVESVAKDLVNLGINEHLIKTERFGG